MRRRCIAAADRTPKLPGMDVELRHPSAPAAGVAGSVVRQARAAHTEAAARSTSHTRWSADHPDFGATSPAAAECHGPA